MELLKNRNLAKACASFIFIIYSTYSVSAVFKTALVLALALVLVSAYFIYAIKRLPVLKKLLISYTPLVILSIAALIISLWVFSRDKEEASELLEYDLPSFEGTVIEIDTNTDYLDRYIVKLHAVNGHDEKLSVLLETPNTDYPVGTTVSGSGYFVELENPYFGYSEADYYISRRIFLKVYSEEIVATGATNPSVLSRARELSAILRERFNSALNEETSSLFSALFLGYRDELSPEVERDFARVGISHVLSLSGLHLTIIIAVLSLLLSLTTMSNVSRTLLLVSSTMFYYVMTGMSESCFRAALMLVLFSFISLFGREIDKISSLLIAVAIIYLLDPYSAFSISLTLSFLAMLACFASFRFIKRVKKLRRVPFKPLRYTVYTLITTLFVTLFTMPVIAPIFGRISLMTFVSNLLITPVFTVLICACPLMLSVADVPYISDGLAGLCERLSSLVLQVVEILAEPRLSVISVSHEWQGRLSVLIFSVLALMTLAKRRHIKPLLILSSLLILTFSLVTLSIWLDKEKSDYVNVYSDSYGDYVAIESDGELYVVDISQDSTAVSSTVGSLMSFCGHTEIEQYIITDYSHTTPYFVNALVRSQKVRSLCLPSPECEEELSLYTLCEEACENEGVILSTVEPSLMLGKLSVDLLLSSQLERSERRSVSFTVSSDTLTFAYLGASSYEITSYFPENAAHCADILVLGDVGPRPHMPYEYECPYLDYLVFLPSAQYYATEEFISTFFDKILSLEEKPLCFKL